MSTTAFTAWNPWHGCKKYSSGCKNCYVYSRDSKYEIDSTNVRKTASFDLPIRKNRAGEYKIPSGVQLGTCFTSDFFIEDADKWRADAWAFMKERSDLLFLMLTKRILRAESCFPADWGDGYPNVSIGCTCENQQAADERLPTYGRLPIYHKFIAAAPILEAIDLRNYLSGIEKVSVGGESGANARPCHYDWVLSLSVQCRVANVGFWFQQTGANFIKDGKQYTIPRRLQHVQAKKSGLSTTGITIQN